MSDIMNTIIPVPASINYAEGTLALAGEATIAVPPGRIEIRQVAELFIASVKPLTGLEFRVLESGSGTVVLRESAGVDSEGYELAVSTSGAEIVAATPVGFLYGLQSFAQLLPLNTASAELACRHITDHPRFKWRGVLLDCARGFFAKREILKLLDTMSGYKLNRFHWHLIDDQGWRLEIRKYPDLTAKGARFSGSETREEGFFYTQDDIREIVAYAAERGITVVPEIEMPGHSGAILGVLPELRCDPGGASDGAPAAGPSNVYCAGNEETFSVIEDILEEVFSLFPSEIIHIGGDEANKVYWENCPKCRARMKDEGLNDVDELQSYFVKRVESIFLKHGKRLIGWDEILDGGLAPSAAVMYWRSEEGDGSLQSRVRDAALKDHQLVMTPQTHCYFDYHQDSEWFHEPSGLIGTVTLKDAYAFDPIPRGLPEERYRNILGGQCNMWNDGRLDLSGIEYMLFPRALALAEAVWSPQARRDYSSLADRILTHLRRLEALDVNARYPDGIEFVYGNGAFTLEPELPGAGIHFTLDGGEPTSGNTVYDGPVEVSRPTLVRAAVVKDDGGLGRVKSFMASNVIDSKHLTVLRSTASDPDHPPTELAGRFDWEMWVTAAGTPFPHEIVFDLGSDAEIAGFIYEPRLIGSLDGNILEYELHLSGGAGSQTVHTGRFSGRREKQYVLFDNPVAGRLATLVVLDAVGGVTAMWGFKLICD